MKQLSHNGLVVATGAMLSKQLGCSESRFKDNFAENKSRYQEGVHYYLLKGADLKEFKNRVENSDLVQIDKRTSHLYLWTEKGAFNHVKSLGTDEAWDAYQNLVDTYFRVRDLVALPSIDDLVANPDLVIQLATQVKEEKAIKLQLQAQVQKMQAKSDFVDRIIDNDEKIDVGQAAKILALPFGRNTLFERLREKGVFFKNKNEPKQEYLDRGYFVLKEKYIERNSHDGFTVIKVLVTQKGLAFIHKLFPSEPSSTKMSKIS